MSGEARLVPKDAERNLELARSRRVLARFESGADLRAMAAAVQAVLGYVPPLAIALLAQKADLAEEQVLARIGEDEEQYRDTGQNEHGTGQKQRRIHAEEHIGDIK